MRSRFFLTFAFLLLLLLLVLGACSGDSSDDDLSCRSDSDCSVPGTRCDEARSLCVCTTDEVCPSGTFCNVAGACQRRSGCSRNSDCNEGTFCDINSGVCLEEPPAPSTGTPCGLASHCPFGTVCRAGRCEAGCFGDGDCPLGQICFEEQCATGGPNQTVCSSSDFCPYGQSCGGDNLCRADRRGPYCRGCSRRDTANPTPCDDPRNFCLINSREFGGFTNFCGVDCSLGQPCPSGYTCGDVVVLTQSTCSSTAECRCDPNQVSFATSTCQAAQPCQPTLPDGTPDPNARSCVIERAAACSQGAADCVVPRGQTTGNCTCASDGDCPNAGQCVAGLCCTGNVRPEEDLTCVGGEGRVLGFCTCATDDDCGRDSCDPTSGSCRITGLPCSPGANDCPPIACVNGGCLIGQNCAPEQGLTCSIVTSR